MYDQFDYEGEDDEESPFAEPAAETETPLPDLQIDIPPAALGEVLRLHVREALPARTIRAMAQDRVEKIFDEELNAWIRKAIGKEVTGLVEEYFTKERVCTNDWGEPSGGTEALGDAVIKKTEIYLKKSDRHNSNSRLEEMVQEVLFKPLEQRLSKMLKEVKAQQEERATSFIAKMMADSLKVLGDSR